MESYMDSNNTNISCGNINNLNQKNVLDNVISTPVIGDQPGKGLYIGDVPCTDPYYEPYDPNNPNKRITITPNTVELSPSIPSTSLNTCTRVYIVVLTTSNGKKSNLGVFKHYDVAKRYAEIYLESLKSVFEDNGLSLPSYEIEAHVLL